MTYRKKNLPQSGPSHEQVTLLARWLTVIADFHFLHAQLRDSLLAHAHTPVSSPEATRWIGQCDTHQMNALLATMHSELEAMLNDANQFNHITRHEGYARLTTHVDHVAQLNQQAKALLYLTSLPIG